MKQWIAGALVALFVVPAEAQQCRGGGVPGLASVAARLKVRPTVASQSALNDCLGNSYEIGALLAAAVDRIEKAEKNAADAIEAVKKSERK